VECRDCSHDMHSGPHRVILRQFGRLNHRNSMESPVRGMCASAVLDRAADAEVITGSESGHRQTEHLGIASSK